MPFAQPDGAVPAGTAPGLTVFVIVERWALDAAIDGTGWTLEAAHLTLDGARANLAAPVGRERFVTTMEVQP